jgi:hypothetical protein
MSRYLLFIISSFIISSEISNIQVSQRQDGSGIVDICYDLIEDEGIYGSFSVNLEISFDGGETYSSVSSSSLYGDAGDNVIPGNSLCMQYQAQSELFIAQAKVKIIASSSFVSSQLPFSMVNIVSNSDNQSNSYEGETIDYDYEMMQFELTNVDLVTFLETYSFELSAGTDDEGVEYDSEPIYDCNNFTEYFNADPSQEAGTIYGCMNPEAVNYNPGATEEPIDHAGDGVCFYEGDGGCQDSSAINYDFMNPDPVPFDDCSCAYEPVITDTGQDGGCNWVSWSSVFAPDPGDEGDGGGEQGFDSDEFWEEWALDWNTSGIPGNIYSFSGCSDPSAINYHPILPDFVNELQSQASWNPYLNIDNLEECIIFDNSSCVYECDYNLGDSSSQAPVNINTFETDHISRQGNSFLIAEGKANYPVILNSKSCVDGVIAKLFMDYYGLRIPTAGEWRKAAREDNTRCWPWMEGTCESVGSAYCAEFYSADPIWGGNPVTTQEELDSCLAEAGGPACIDYCGDLYFSCSEDCYTALDACILVSEDPDCSGGPQGEPIWDDCDCMIPFGQCDATCAYNESLCQDQCYDNGWSSSDCEFLYEQYQSCANAVRDGECDQIDVDSWEGETSGLDWFQGGPAEMYYDNPWLFGGGDPNDIPGYEYFTHSLFYDRFSLADCFGVDDCGYDSENGGTTIGLLNITSVGQYPMGQSSLGLYDMIGNAPEAVMYIGDPTSSPALYTLNYMPEEEILTSFCASDAMQWSSGEHPSAGLMRDEDYADYFQYYGLRLARTLAQ